MPGSKEENVVLVVGSLGLDRLLTVQKYPEADSKIRTTAYHEQGGGNAGNTACAMARMRDAEIYNNKNIQIKLLTKVGDDSVGRQLIEELESFNVNTSSPLFLKGPSGSTTSFTTVIVTSNTDDEQHEQQPTRTCIHTPGTSGNLTIDDVKSVDLDEVFSNAVHLHSDSRHTECSLYLAKEAKKRGIPVSCDTEKDRKVEALDELIGISDLIFTNSSCLMAYLGRLDSEMETTKNRKPLPKATITCSKDGCGDPTAETLDLYSRSFTPSTFFSRWYLQQGKQVVVTLGEIGALHFEETKVSHVLWSRECEQEQPGEVLNKIELFKVGNMLHIRHSSDDTIVHCQSEHKIRQAGIVSGTKVVDTTGAGDAFIGGYLMAKLFNSANELDDDPVQFALSLGTWVAGRKVEGPGARSTLPNGAEIDKVLGNTKDHVQKTLASKLSPFKCAI